jgi:osmotically-inducible protein OsmY
LRKSNLYQSNLETEKQKRKRTMKRWMNLSMLAGCACGIWLAFGGLAVAASNDLDDADITLAVETKLLVDDSVPSHKIDVSTQNGIVTLSGSVNTYYAKLEAKNTAESVKGVLAVINNIDVQPPKRLDSHIRGDIISDLVLDPVTESYEVDVAVEDGVVTLTGKVDSYAEKTVAENVAEKVSGVTDVKNLLTYDLVSDRTDADIREDIKYRLRSDASIDSSLLTVSVDEGEVTLAGSASSSAEKSEAETEAWVVPGVQSVTNNIQVEWWLDSEISDWGDGWTDDNMQQAIENALLTNPRVNAFNVLAAVENGVATLTGTVSNLQAKQVAEEEAEDILGVWRVKNFLRVRPALSRTDTEIAQDIRSALQRNPYVDRYDITVNVYNGKAYLTGEVDSWFQKNEAEDVAAGVLGVVEIRNNLDVDYQFTAKTDREIKEDIEDQLWWSPFVDSDDITVEVHSGVATLTGSVDDWGELKAARDNARQGGAVAVVSQLDINNGGGGTY